MAARAFERDFQHRTPASRAASGAVDVLTAALFCQCPLAFISRQFASRLRRRCRNECRPQIRSSALMRSSTTIHPPGPGTKQSTCHPSSFSGYSRAHRIGFPVGLPWLCTTLSAGIVIHDPSGARACHWLPRVRASVRAQSDRSQQLLPSRGFFNSLNQSRMYRGTSLYWPRSRALASTLRPIICPATASNVIATFIARHQSFDALLTAKAPHRT